MVRVFIQIVWQGLFLAFIYFKTKQRKGDKTNKMPKEDGYKNLIPLNKRTPEERQAIIEKGIAKRKENKEKKMALQKCMKALLEMPTKTEKQKAILKQFGFEDDRLTNETLLMVALFQKGITGDVQAIREIARMMQELEVYKSAGQLTSGNVTINLITEGEVYKPSEQIEKEIWDVENNMDSLFDESNEPWDDDDDWGSEVYNP